MGKFLMAVIVMMSINIVLWLTQASMVEINPSTSVSFFNVSNSPASMYIDDEGELVNRSVNETLPTEVRGESGGITTTLTSFFTDPISTIKNFFLKTLGFEYILNILRAPYDFLKSAGVPREIALAVAVLWYSFTALLLTLLIIGRDN